MDYIALAIPVFFSLMGLEWVVARARGVEVYRFADWVANLGCGIIQQTFKVVLALFTFLAYRYLFDHHRAFAFDAASGWTWLLCFLGVDFCYYWFHRSSHEINFLWAAHVVHHQSEEYNLGVALRQSAFQGAFSWIFYLPLALIGFPPLVFGVVVSLNTLYQFWIHTQLIGRLGPLEHVLNTPSHHRVHHGQNPQYIDRNHAGTLIIWDKLFGTFEPEREKVIYGVTEPPRSWNPIFANFHHFGLTWSRMRSAPRWQDKLAAWLGPPGYLPKVRNAGYRGSSTWGRGQKYDTPAPSYLVGYVAIQFLALTAATTAYLFLRSRVDALPLAAWGLAIVLTAGSLGALLDGRRWVRPLEAARPALIYVGFAAIRPDVLLEPIPLIFGAAAATLSAIALSAALSQDPF